MPETKVFFYQEENGNSPVRDWLFDLQQKDRKAFANCVAAIYQLATFGHELRRPQADYLREGIYELRVKKEHVNYRILYFFHGRNVALLAHALTKKAKVPDIDINRALIRKKQYEQEPENHALEEIISDA